MAQMNLKDFTSLYKIKQFYADKVAPQYFDIDTIDTSNVGLFGYVTEALGTNVEDSFFATTMLFKEIFPVTAEDPESIYLMAALFQMDNHFATAATMGFNILIAEDDVISHGTYSNGFWTLNIDRDMVINVDGIPFLLDYDITITSAKTDQGYTHTARYIMEDSFHNSISDIKSPYIPTRVHNHTENNKRYVLMTVNLHQVSKTTTEDTVLTNDRINIVTKEYPFSGQLANFEIFYRKSDADAWEQMTKFVANSSSVSSSPCYYYKFIDDGKLQISFNTDDRYFIPAFNSQLRVEMYTTLGADGNFTHYTGQELSVSAVSSKYESNKGLIFIGNVRSGSLGGYNAKTVEELKIDVIKAFSTVKSFTTASDLTLYFNNLRLNRNNELLFLKQRDDSLKRLFSAFVLFKDSSNIIIPTNTVDIRFDSIIADSAYVQSGRYVLNAGKLYEMRSGSNYIVQPARGITIDSDLDQYEGKKYIYINPFLTVVSFNPAMVGYYINTINDTVSVDFHDVNTASFNQFVVNNMTVKRDALAGDKTYLLTIKLFPTTELPEPAFTKLQDKPIGEPFDPDVYPTDKRTFVKTVEDEGKWYLYQDNDVVKCILKLDETAGYFVNVRLTDFDEDSYHMTAELTTNDFISLNNRVAITSGMSRLPNGKKQVGDVMVRCYNAKATIYTFLNYEGSSTAGVHPYSIVPEYANATWTNTYTITNDLNFVIPVSEIVSTLIYEEKTAPTVDTIKDWWLSNFINMDTVHEPSEFDKFEEYFDQWRMLMNADDKVDGYDEELLLSHDETVEHPAMDYYTRILSVPMVKANIMKTATDFNDFLDNFRSMYSYLKSAMENLTNNFDIDLKFFNTFGPSRHFYYYDNYGNKGLMDKINIKLHFGVKFNITNGIETAIADLKSYIIDYVESDEISLISAPSLYISNLIQSIINDFESVAYITFIGLNDYSESVQKFESEITDINVLEGSFATNDVVPEYLTIDYIITKTIKTPQVIIDVL